MSYLIRHTNGTLICELQDQTINTAAAPITLIGRAYTNYGERLNDNLVSMVENFSNTIPPAYAFNGQLWYNSTSGTLSLFDQTSSWSPMASQQWVTGNFVSSATGYGFATQSWVTGQNYLSSLNTTPGTYTKFVVNADGLVVSGNGITVSDMPYIPIQSVNGVAATTGNNGAITVSLGSQAIQSVSMSGDVVAASSTSGSMTTVLAASGVTAGIYSKVTVDTKGRVTLGSLISGSDVMTALGNVVVKVPALESLNVYVNSSTSAVGPWGAGSDTTGTGAQASPFLTIQKAIDQFAYLYNFYGNAGINVLLAPSGSISPYAAFNVSGNIHPIVTVTGSASTPSNYLITNTTGVTSIGCSQGGNLSVTGVTITAPSPGGTPTPYIAGLGYGVFVSTGAKITLWNFIIGSCGSVQIVANSGGNIYVNYTSYTINGSSPVHIQCAAGGYVYMNANTVTLTGSPTFSNSFLNCYTAQINYIGNTFSGSITGAKWGVGPGGWISTNGGYTALPGSITPAGGGAINASGGYIN